MSHAEQVGGKSSEHPSSWRSRGWIPLAYPKSALESNPFFPMHKAVLKAAIRELLILDGSLDGTTLTFKTTDIARMSDSRKAKVAVAPRYHCHNDPSRFQLVGNGKIISEKAEEQSKCALRTVERISCKRQRILTEHDDPSIDASPTNSDDLHFAVLSDLWAPGSASTVQIAAESVVESLAASAVLAFSRAKDDDDSQENTKATSVKQTSSETILCRAPRKVSDTDTFRIHSEKRHFVTEQTVGPTDICKFLALHTRGLDGNLRWIRTEDIPQLCEVSIATEATLRAMAFDMAHGVCKSFNDPALRLFLGYKTPCIQRDSLIRTISDFIFDCSHAFFAFTQTEMELQNKQSVPLKERDEKIKNSLFDSRALRKIGGFEETSLLPHALSIQRMDEDGISWAEFAQTSEAKAMLHHHTNPCKRLLVGQRRRSQRLRQRFEPWVGRSQRERSSSCVSSDTDGSASVSEEIGAERRQVVDVPSAMKVHMARAPGSSWGVLLARESDMCVVVRGNPGKQDTLFSELHCGDIILHVENRRGERAGPPSFLSKQDASHGRQGWFRMIVDMFKSNDELTLTIQRVGRS